MQLDKREEIKFRVDMILVCKKLAAVANKKALQFPGLSEIASQVVRDQKDLITKYTNEIREVQKWVN